MKIRSLLLSFAVAITTTASTPVKQQFSAAEQQQISIATPGLFKSYDAFNFDFGTLRNNEYSFPLPVGKATARKNGSVEIVTKDGDAVKAMFEGTVRLSRKTPDLGNAIVIRHRNGLETVYGNNAENLVDVGAHVKARQTIAIVGERDGKVYCDFSIMVNGGRINPTSVVNLNNHHLKRQTLLFEKDGAYVNVTALGDKSEFEESEEEMKLDELFAVANRVVVLRDGCVTGELDIAATTRDQLIARMVGREMKDMYPKTACEVGETIFRVDKLSTDALKEISFETRRGEVFGIYGLMGSGHERIGAALFGQDIITGGDVYIHGKRVKINMPMDAIRNGVAYVPAERKTEGLVLNQSVMVNAASARYSKEHPFFLNAKRDMQSAQKWIEALRIKTPRATTKVESLSGGNQQKVVLAKWLELSPDVFILNEPTRGIDVGAKAEIYRILNDLCAQGKCVIIITSEMPELLAISDRIMVMFEGRVSGFLEGSEATQERVVELAIGG